MSKKVLFACIALLVFSLAVTAFTNHNSSNNISSTYSDKKDSSKISEITSPYYNVYDSLHLESLNLSREAYEIGLKGFQKLVANGQVKNPNILTIVDFSQASTKRRMYIIDLKNCKLLQQSLVAHGRNTGHLMAKSFSNIAESYQSSLGFYIANETYQGKHGLSLRLDGMEKNINDNARNRAIVIHGADYATETFSKSAGYLGRSFGCPAVPQNVSKNIINTLSNGSCLFIYFPDKNYLHKSTLIS